MLIFESFQKYFATFLSRRQLPLQNLPVWTGASSLDRSQAAQGRSDSKRLGSKTGRGMKHPKAQVSENNGLNDSTSLQELDGLVKQVEMFKNKIRDLFMRAQEMKPCD